MEFSQEHIETIKQAGFIDATGHSLMKAAIKVGYISSEAELAEVLKVARAVNDVSGQHDFHFAFLAEALQYKDRAGIVRTSQEAGQEESYKGQLSAMRQRAERVLAAYEELAA